MCSLLNDSCNYYVIKNQITEKPSVEKTHGNNLVVNQYDQECSLLHLLSSLINYEGPSKNDSTGVESIPHSILDHNEL